MDAQQWISLYKAGFYISLIVAALGFALAGMLFFRYDIRTVWQIRTGKAKRAGVAALQRASRDDGQMRKDKEQGYSTEEMAGARAKTTEDLHRAAQNTTGAAVSAATLLLQGQQAPEMLPTEPLAPPPRQPAEGSVEADGFGDTVDLLAGRGGAPDSGELSPPPGFVITQDTVVVHSNEKL